MSLSTAMLAQGFAVLQGTCGAPLTLRGLAVSGVVNRLRGESDSNRFDRSRINYGTRGASVIELAILDFAPSSFFAAVMPKPGEELAEHDGTKHVITFVQAAGATLLCYCKTY